MNKKSKNQPKSSNKFTKVIKNTSTKTEVQSKKILSSDNHPDHSSHLARLKRVKGQIDGIERMIVDRRYCPDIMVQLKAASSALKAIEAEIFKSHLRGCVKQAFNMDDAFKTEEKIQEIIKLVY